MNRDEETVFLRSVARDIYDHALKAVDARAAVNRAVSFEEGRLTICETTLDPQNHPIYSVAIGKAARPMAAGLHEVLGPKLVKGVLSGPAPARSDPLNEQRWTTFAGGHPLPNQQSLDAAQAVFKLLNQAEKERALVIFLISGGGSAMLEWPRTEKITLEDLREANRQLVSCGANIAEINSVRAAFSAVKGGGLARLAPNSQPFTLIISDTNPAEVSSVASGPTINPSPDAPIAREVVQRYQLASSMPRTILEIIETFVAPEMSAASRHCTLLDNKTALEAAADRARELGFATTIAEDICEQPIGEGCTLLLERLDELVTLSPEPVCLISGGEFSCPVRGDGKGGRNVETVVRCAIEMNEHDLPTVVLSAGTDGIDGNSPAAGAIADQTTINRAIAASLDPHKFLNNSDSFSLVDQLGDTITTGPTGTNVRDLRILLSLTSAGGNTTHHHPLNRTK